MLRETTLKLIQRLNTEELQKLSYATEIQYHWLYNFKVGKLKTADVDRVEKVYEQLSGRKICL